MLNCWIISSTAMPTRRPLRPRELVVAMVMAGMMGCGESGTVSVEKTSRSRIVSDANADGTITPSKSRNPRKPPAGLKTIKTLKDQKDQKEEKDTKD